MLAHKVILFVSGCVLFPFWICELLSPEKAKKL